MTGVALLFLCMASFPVRRGSQEELDESPSRHHSGWVTLNGMTNPYQPPPETDSDVAKPVLDGRRAKIAKFSVILIGLNGLAVVFGGTPMMGLIVVGCGVLFWLGGRSAGDD